VNEVAVLSALRRVINGAQAFGVASNEQNDLLVAQNLPPYAELARIGAGWQVMDTSATAAVVVRPSTVAGLTLWNGEAAGGKTYVIDRVFAFNLVSTDAIADWSVWGCVHPVGMAAPTADITAIKNMNGYHSSYGGKAIVDTAATVLDNGWFPLDSVGSKVGNPGGVTPGTAIAIPIEGRLEIPPTAGFSINIVASLVTWTFTHGFSWYEVQQTNE
jgi:hypothetical protein